MVCDRVGRYTINIRRMTRSKRPRSQFHSTVTTLHLQGLAAYPKLELQNPKIDEIGASIQFPTPATFRLFVQPRRSCLALLRLTFKHGFRSVSHIAVDLRHVLSTAQEFQRCSSGLRYRDLIVGLGAIDNRTDVPSLVNSYFKLFPSSDKTTPGTCNLAIKQCLIVLNCTLLGIRADLPRHVSTDSIC